MLGLLRRSRGATLRRPRRLRHRRGRCWITSFGLARHHQPALVEPVHVLAEALHRADVVAHQHDGLALALESREDVDALALELGVADGEDLVEQQRVGVGAQRGREGEAHHHAGRQALQLRVPEALEAGERDHLVDAPGHRGARVAEHRPVELDVLAHRTAPAGSPSPSSSSGTSVPCTRTWPSSGTSRPAMTFSSVDLPEPFAPMTPTKLPRGTSSVTSRQRVQDLDVVRPERPPGARSASVVCRSCGMRNCLRDVADLDGVHGQKCSTRRACWRWNIAHPTARTRTATSDVFRMPPQSGHTP